MAVFQSKEVSTKRCFLTCRIAEDEAGSSAIQGVKERGVHLLPFSPGGARKKACVFGYSTLHLFLEKCLALPSCISSTIGRINIKQSSSIISFPLILPDP